MALTGSLRRMEARTAAVLVYCARHWDDGGDDDDRLSSVSRNNTSRPRRPTPGRGADGDPLDPAFQEHPAGTLGLTRPSARAARLTWITNLYCAGANSNDVSALCEYESIITRRCVHVHTRGRVDSSIGFRHFAPGDERSIFCFVDYRIQYS